MRRAVGHARDVRTRKRISTESVNLEEVVKACDLDPIHLLQVTAETVGAVSP